MLTRRWSLTFKANKKIVGPWTIKKPKKIKIHSNLFIFDRAITSYFFFFYLIGILHCCSIGCKIEVSAIFLQAYFYGVNGERYPRRPFKLSRVVLALRGGDNLMDNGEPRSGETGREAKS